MKKGLFLLLLVCLVHLPSYAVLTPEESISEPYIKNHGHSDEMSRIIDLQNSQINGVKPTYQNNDPEWYDSNKKVNFIRKVMMYFDCGLDDGTFGKGNVNYTTRWNDI